MVGGVAQAGQGQAQAAAEAHGGGSLESGNGGDSPGNVQDQASVAVLDQAMESQEQQAQQLIESSMGVGQNMNFMA